MGHMGHRIRILRERKGWSLREMAEVLGNVKFQTIAKWESGDINLPSSRVTQLAILFDVTPGSFYPRREKSLAENNHAAEEKIGA